MERDLRTLLDAIVAGLIVADCDGCVEELNTAASRLLERSSRQAIGRPLEDLITPDHAVAHVGREALRRGAEVSASSQTVERRTGPDAVVDVTATPLLDREGRIDGVVLVLRDRAAQNRLELLEQEKERFDAFGRIAAGLAHEVKNPLGGIQGAGEILGRRSEDPKTKEIADLIVREAMRIASLVDDFMVFARGDQLSPDVVNIHKVLEHVLELVALDPKLGSTRVTRSFDPSIPDLVADRDRLIQVFLNLVRNACQSMEPDGGELAIRTRVTLDHRLVRGDGRSMPTVAIWIEDEGRGMDADELRQATTPFFTTRSGGTGLGLAVAEYWITQHEGTMHIESEEGLGTRVRVALPLRRGSPRPTREPDAAS